MKRARLPGLAYHGTKSPQKAAEVKQQKSEEIEVDESHHGPITAVDFLAQVTHYFDGIAIAAADSYDAHDFATAATGSR